MNATANTTPNVRIAVYAPSVKLGYRDLLAVNAFHELASRFEVVWLFSGAVPEIGFDDTAMVRTITSDAFRYRSWLRLHALVRYEFDNRIFGGRQRRPTLGLGRRDQFMLATIIRSRLSFIARTILKFGLAVTSPDLSQSLKGCGALLCFGSSKDLLFDDLVRAARKLSVPVVMVPLNWDNATSKPYIERPELILTWGEQTAELSALLHNVKSLPLGSPRFDAYRHSPLPTPAEARVRLGLREDLQYILFAGVGYPFVEIETLQRLVDSLEQQGRHDMRIVYRPHPYSWKGFSKASLGPALAEKIIFDPSLELFAKNDMRQYAYILSSISALVTPFSSLAVEAAFHRLPTLCIAFDDPLERVVDWKLSAQNQPHLRIFNEESWPLRCFESENLEPMFIRLLDSIGDATVGEMAFSIFRKIVHTDGRGYVDRLCEMLELELSKSSAGK